MSGLKDKLRNAALDYGDTVGDTLRYGVTAPQKAVMTSKGQIPGAPGTDILNPEVERYASNYLGARQNGIWPSLLFNAIAIHDMENPDQAKANKEAGIRGALRGALSSPIPKIISPAVGGGAVGPIFEALSKAFRGER